MRHDARPESSSPPGPDRCRAAIHPGDRKQVEAAAKGRIPRSKTTFLSPFDPLVWDRKRALDLFNFDYKIEVYTPAPKRKYGYFTLPILYNNALIGRIDPKAHRKEGIFEVKALHLEPGVIVDDALIAGLLSRTGASHAILILAELGCCV